MKKALLSGLLVVAAIATAFAQVATRPPAETRPPVDAVRPGVESTVFTSPPQPPGSGVDPRWNNLVAGWHLDEASGTRVDVLGNFDLTDNNTVGVSPYGPSGTVANFDATDDYLASALAFSADAAITYAGWITTNDIVGNRNVLYSGGGFNFDLRLTGGQFQAASHGSVIAVTDLNVMVPGRPYFVVAWHDPVADTLNTQVNLGAIQSMATGGPNGATTAADFGRVSGLGTTYDGTISRDGLWNRVLSAADRESLFNQGNAKLYSDLTAAEKVGLSAYWNKNESSGTRFDSHGSNDLTDNNAVGSVTAVPGAIYNAAADFEADNLETLSNASPSLTLTTAATWSFWLRAESATPAMGIITRWTYATDGEWGVQWDGNLQVFIANAPNDTGTSYFSTSFTPTLGEWNHLLIVYDGSQVVNDDRIVVYLNGVAQSGVMTGTIPTSMLNNGTAPLVVGSWAGTLSTRVLDGTIDEFGIWSRVLTAQERADLFNSGAGLPYEN